MRDQKSLRSACTYVQSDQSLCQSLEYSMSVKLLTEHHLEGLSFKGCCAGSSESTLVKMPHFWQSHVTAQKCDDSILGDQALKAKYCVCRAQLTSACNLY